MRIIKILLALVGLINCAALAAQSEGEARSMLDKVSGFGELVIDQLTFPTEKGVFAIYPSGGYSSRTGLEFGIMPIYSWDNPALPVGIVNTLTSTVQISTKGMIEVSGELEWYLSADRLVRGQLEWLRLNDKYWGLWSAQEIPETEYRSDRIMGELSFFQTFGKGLYAGINAKAGHYNISSVNSQETSGESDSTGGPANSGITSYGADAGTFVAFGPSMLYDSRNHVLAPTRGTYVNTTVTFYDKGFGSDFSFTNYLADFRCFVPLGQSVLGFQGLWEYSNGTVPFFMMPQLGGKERLRGIGHSNRVIDNSVLLVRSEVRRHLWWRIGGVLFAGAGQASGRPELKVGQLIYSGGAGLRFRLLPDEPLNVRLDAAVSSEGFHGIFISLREAF